MLERTLQVFGDVAHAVGKSTMSLRSKRRLHGIEANADRRRVMQERAGRGLQEPRQAAREEPRIEGSPVSISSLCEEPFGEPF